MQTRRYILLIKVSLFLIVFCASFHTWLQRDITNYQHFKLAFPKSQFVHNASSKLEIEMGTRLLFIGGYPKSGTTLIRAMIGVHPDVHCQVESRILPSFMDFLSFYLSDGEKIRLDGAGITQEMINSASKKFINHFIMQTKNTIMSCIKDPFIMRHSKVLSSIYPSARFILMLRDGRAVGYSLQKSNRNVIQGLNATNLKRNVDVWTVAINDMVSQCKSIANCMIVYYEGLVNYPEKWMRKITTFLGIKWHDRVLHHHLHSEDISISRYEPSSYKSLQHIHKSSLGEWKTYFKNNKIKLSLESLRTLQSIGYTSVTGDDYDKLTPDYNIISYLATKR